MKGMSFQIILLAVHLGCWVWSSQQFVASSQMFSVKLQLHFTVEPPYKARWLGPLNLVLVIAARDLSSKNTSRTSLSQDLLMVLSKLRQDFIIHFIKTRYLCHLFTL